MRTGRRSTYQFAGMLVLALGFAGCCSKEACQRKYGLTDPMTEADCKTKYTNLIGRENCNAPPPVPGPRIIVGAKSADPTKLEWGIVRSAIVTDTITHTGNINKSDPKLRKDFIGKKVIFDVQTSTGTVQGRHVVLTKAGVKIEIFWLPSTNDVFWIYTDTSVTPEESYFLDKENIPTPDTLLPLEFENLDSASCMEAFANKACTGFTLQVNY